MALDTAGRHDAAAGPPVTTSSRRQSARRLVPGVARLDPDATDGHVDTNAVAYVAAGALHHSLSTADAASGAIAVAVVLLVEAAVDYVLSGPARRRRGGVVARPGCRRLGAPRAPPSAVYLSPRCRARLAAPVGAGPTSHGSAARRALRRAIVGGGAGTFLDKSEYAMDWYYPVLSGALDPAAARRRIAAGERCFVVAEGVRCRSDRRWVTTAETAECVLAYLRLGDSATALRLFSSLGDKRRSSGAYLTGLVHPERSEFPLAEETTYSAAAALLAADALGDGAATTALFSSRQTRTRRLPTAAPTSSVKAPEAMASR